MVKKFSKNMVSSGLFEDAKTYNPRKINTRAIQVGEDFEVETDEGIMSAKSGDYLILGVEGEIYPCRKSVFEAKYREVKDNES